MAVRRRVPKRMPPKAAVLSSRLPEVPAASHNGGNGRCHAHSSGRRRGFVQRIRAHWRSATLQAVDECSSEAQECLRAVILLRSLVGVDSVEYVLCGYLVLDAFHISKLSR